MNKSESMSDKEKNVYAEERELLHKQLELLAERSKDCSPTALAELSAQMVSVYAALNPYQGSRFVTLLNYIECKETWQGGDKLEQLKEPRFYPNESSLPLGAHGNTEKTLQSIDDTLKRIETILLERKNPLQALRDAVEVSVSQPQEQPLVLRQCSQGLSQ